MARCLFTCVFVVAVVGILSIIFGGSTGEVEVTSGASLIPIEDVTIYFDEEQVLFPFPDIPELDQMHFYQCEGHFICPQLKHVNKINNQTFVLQSLVRKLYTYGGIGDIDDDGLHKILNVETINHLKNNEEFKELMGSTGIQWFTNITSIPSHKIGKRALPPALIKAGAMVARFGPKIFKNLFVQKGDLVKSLVRRIAMSPESRRHFLRIMRKVSQIAGAEDEGNSIVKQEFTTPSRINEITDFLVTAGQKGKLQYIVAATLFPDVAYLLFHSTIASIHAQAFTSCRANEIPIAFVPPEMLKDRLSILEKQLISTAMELAIKAENVMQYYKLKRAECTYTDDGGVILVDVALTNKKMTMQMFRVSSILYRWKDHVCDVGLNEMFVLRDVNSKEVYPITDVAEESCSPLKTKMCQVPLVSTAETDEHLCLRAILREAATEDLRKVCKMDCRMSSGLEIAQPAPDTVILTNLKSDAVAVRQDEKVVYNKRIDIGSIKVTLPCGWKLYVEEKLVAKSMMKSCLQPSKAVAEFCELIPAHWTKLESWFSKPHNPESGMKFADMDSIVNYRWNETEQGGIQGWITTNVGKISWISGSGQVIQAAVTAYMMFKLRANQAALAVMQPQIVQAAEDVYCILPEHDEFILFAILIVVVAILVPGYATRAMDAVRAAWNFALARALANQRERQQNALPN